MGPDENFTVRDDERRVGMLVDLGLRNDLESFFRSLEDNRVSRLAERIDQFARGDKGSPRFSGAGEAEQK